MMAVMKYVLHSIDLQSENPWENKAVYLLYSELILGKCLNGVIFCAQTLSHGLIFLCPWIE